MGEFITNIKILELSPSEYEERKNAEQQEADRRQFQYHYENLMKSGRELDRQIAIALTDLQINSEVRHYPKRNYLDYSLSTVESIDNTGILIVGGKEYSLLTGEGKTGVVLPDLEISDYKMAERIIADYMLRPTAYDLTSEQKLIIAQTLRGN